MQTSSFPLISKSLLSARYTFSKFLHLKFRNNSLFEDEWKDAPESKIQDSIELSTLRIRASPMSSAEFIESVSPDLWFCFLFGLVQSVQKWHFSQQLQHVTFDLFEDISRFFDFDRPLFGPFSLLLPRWSTLRALPDDFPISRLRILLLRTTSRISSNFSLSDPQKLLIETTTVSHNTGKDDIKINALISSSKFISTKLSWLTIILNSFIWSTIDSPSDICRLNNLRIRYTLFIAYGFSYIFDSAFNKSNVVFSLMMLNATFLDSVNQINPYACRSLSFHCSVVMVSDITPNRGSWRSFWYG